jgi:hypothetical protein
MTGIQLFLAPWTTNANSVKHHDFNLMHSISCFSGFLFDEFIIKGGENVHKGDITLLLTE